MVGYIIGAIFIVLGLLLGIRQLRSYFFNKKVFRNGSVIPGTIMTVYLPGRRSQYYTVSVSVDGIQQNLSLQHSNLQPTYKKGENVNIMSWKGHYFFADKKPSFGTNLLLAGIFLFVAAMGLFGIVSTILAG